MTRLIVITGFLIAFTSGVMVGIVSKSGPGAGPGERDHGGPQSMLAAELKLSVDQQKQMKQIWTDVGFRGGHDAREARGQIRRSQEEAIAALIHTEDLAKYDEIINEHKARLDALDAENKKNFQQAVEKTKAILSPEQLKKYEELLSRPGPGPGGPGPGGPGSGPEGHDHNRSASRSSEK